MALTEGATIGIAFRAEPHPGIPLSRSRATHCTFMGRARRGEILHVHLDRLSCPLARYYLGMPKPTLEGTARALRRWADVMDRDNARTFLRSGWRLEGLGPYVLYFPHPTGGLEADVLVRVASVGELSRLAHEHTRRTGERLVASISGLGAACGECTAYPLATGRVNVSLGCRGCRRTMDIAEAEAMVAAPAGTAMYDILASSAQA